MGALPHMLYHFCKGVFYFRNVRCHGPRINLLTPWSRALLEKLIGFAANQEILRILWNPKVHYRLHKYPPPPIPISQLDPFHFLKINIILPSTPGSPKWSPSLRFLHQNPVYASPSYVLHASLISFFSI